MEGRLTTRSGPLAASNCPCEPNKVISISGVPLIPSTSDVPSGTWTVIKRAPADGTLRERMVASPDRAEIVSIPMPWTLSIAAAIHNCR